VKTSLSKNVGVATRVNAAGRQALKVDRERTFHRRLVPAAFPDLDLMQCAGDPVFEGKALQAAGKLN